MNKSEYFAIVADWQARFGVKSRAFTYDPSEVNLCCTKCGKHKAKMSRHHTRNDFFFALWFPNVYAARYIQFLKEDVVKLCEKCHNEIEHFSKRMKASLYFEYNMLKNGDMSEKDWKDWCEQWRGEFRSLYEKWLKRPPRRKKKRRSATKREA